MPYVVAINKHQYVGNNGNPSTYMDALVFEKKSDARQYTDDPAMIKKVDVVIVKYYSDSGHGWYAIKRDILVSLGILDEITSYSYQRGATVYLEEDCDASRMFAKLKEKQIKVEVKVGTNYEGRAPIRSYDCFCT